MARDRATEGLGACGTYRPPWVAGQGLLATGRKCLDLAQPLIYAAILAVLLGYRVWAWSKAPKRKARPKPKTVAAQA